MDIVIMGCGRVGSTLARSLDARGHSVSVIDLDVDAFRRLGPDFSGRTVHGVGFDRQVLLRAGIQDADGFAAVSSGDNSNILAARVVREQFGITNVVARVYDQARAEVYERLGIATVATVRWAAAQVMMKLLPTDVSPEWLDPSQDTCLVRLRYADGWVGMPISRVEAAIDARVPFLSRFGRGTCPGPRTVLQADDQIWVAIRTDRLTEVRTKLAANPPRH
ncbi:MAG: TrkA family potassium uptake protein [Brooklawnia sp.]|uniref:potassium channel family protein n=1 Tax=Brooklawnia sp. TaxID=2699740 RepID=UPI003C707DD1